MFLFGDKVWREPDRLPDFSKAMDGKKRCQHKIPVLLWWIFSYKSKYYHLVIEDVPGWYINHTCHIGKGRCLISMFLC